MIWLLRLTKGLFFSLWVFAQEPVGLDTKTIELEWEPVSQVESYEVRLTPEGGAPAAGRSRQGDEEGRLAKVGRTP